MAWDSTYPERKRSVGEPRLEHGCSAASTREKATLRFASQAEDLVTSFTWNHACSIGVKAMDDQHGVLMDALSDFALRWFTARDGKR